MPPAAHTVLDVDMNQPASSILRAGTIKIHHEISKSKTATTITNGELDKEVYVRYLMMLWHIYDVLEEGLAVYANDSVLSPTYNPALLARRSAIASDIAYYLGVPDDTISWKTHQAYLALISSPPPAFQAYISRLTYVIKQDPGRLLAHSYIRYMGDLSGGQLIKFNIRKTYGLVDEQGSAFYDFRVLGSEGERDPPLAGMGEMKKIKEWFKNGIDAGVGNDVKLKEALLDETARAYSLQEDLFAELEASTSKMQAASRVPDNSAEGQDRKPEKRLSVNSVLTFIFAVGLAHFILVVGGFTGSRGYAKLEAIQTWFSAGISN